MTIRNKDIIEFSKLTEQNFESVMKSEFEVVERIRAVDDAFDIAASNLSKSKVLLQPFFLIRSHSLYRASLRIGLGGQLPETYPLLRTLLENALYAWYLNQHPELNSIWMKRMEGEAEKKKVRKTFQLKPMLEELKSKKLIGDSFINLYENFIDFGAHPNVFGVLSEHEFSRDADGGKFNILYTYDDGPFLRLVLKDLSRAGIGALLLFEDIFKEDFERLGLDKNIRMLSIGL